MATDAPKGGNWLHLGCKLYPEGQAPQPPPTGSNWLKLRYVFVPKDEPPPRGLMAKGHSWLKLPAVMPQPANGHGTPGNAAGTSMSPPASEPPQTSGTAMPDATPRVPETALPPAPPGVMAPCTPGRKTRFSASIPRTQEQRERMAETFTKIGLGQSGDQSGVDPTGGGASPLNK